LVQNVSNTEVEAQISIQEKMALSLAEASALKSGQVLTSTEMSDLIDRLFACSDSNYTPNGKLIMTIIGLDEIGRRFK
jgi:DNA mismatch repair protein MutL